MILITQPRVGTSHNEILAMQMTARDMGWDVLPAPSGWRLDDETIASKVIGVPYGSQLFCEVIAQQMNWKLKANSFDWLAKVPERYTKRHVEFMTMKNAKKINETKFIKPADDKCFDAKVYEVGSFNPSDLIEDDYPVLVSDVVSWDLEYRFFVDEFKVKTWSNYIYYNNIANPKYYSSIPSEEYNLILFAEDLLNDLSNLNIETVPSVIDIGRIPGKGWAVIETNPAWASGLYGCDPGEALNVMSKTYQNILKG